MSDEPLGIGDGWKSIKIIFGGLLMLFGGGCVGLWLRGVVLGQVALADESVLPVLALGLAVLALGVVLVLKGMRQSRNDTRND